MRRGLVTALAVVATVAVAACDAASKADGGAAPTGAPGQTVTVALDERPFQLHIPTSLQAGTAAPLVVLLHGYRSDGGEANDYFKLAAESDRRGFFLATPEGTEDSRSYQFWNATDACCDFYRSGVDDVAYLHRLLDEVKKAYPVDARRVYFVGHSNGGFMAYRMACAHAGEITAVVSVAGAVADDPAACAPAQPVSVLHIHGTADGTIRYDGGWNGRQSYPSAATTLARWRGHNGCGDQADTAGPAIDLEAELPGAETTVTTYRTGCRNGSRVEFWSIKEGAHVPTFNAGLAPAIADFLLARS